MNKGSYNFNNLKNYCSENNILLINNYEDIKITRDTNIEGKCVNSCCSDNFNKIFRQLKKTGAFCKKCTKINKQINFKKTNFEKYGLENPSQLEETKQKIKQTNLQKYGVENLNKVEEIKNKRIKTCLEKYGVEYHIQSNKTREKIKITNLEKYGVECVFQSEEIKQKIKETNVQNYGVECVFQSEEIKQKIKTTNQKNYGVEYIMQSSIVRNKSKATCLKNYGVEHQLNSCKIKEKIKNTCLEKYGVENPHQDPEIAEKASKNSYRKKTYILPSGNELLCQGYEPLALNKLVKEDNILEEDIVTGCKNVPQIWYDDENGKKHRHYVDIYIPSQNRCIEVKSTWTAEKKKDNIYLKQNAAKELGYKYEIWIYNSKKELIEIKI
jgi:hypothetical protein